MCEGGGGGLRLHKFTSNSKDVIAAIPREDHATTLKNLDLHTDCLPVERALGVYWCVESDTFQMRITLQDTPLTRRGILSTISSIYDPLGFVAPVLLVGKQPLHELCREGTDLDDPVPDQTRLESDGRNGVANSAYSTNLKCEDASNQMSSVR